MPADGRSPTPIRYYEVASGQCEKFEYSGCGGNANRFNTLDECQVG